jgi:hypothetical protein
VHPSPIGKPRVGVGRGVIQAATARRDQTDRQSTRGVLVRNLQPGLLKPVAAIDPYRASPVDQYVGDPGLREQRLKQTRTTDLRSECACDIEQRGETSGRCLIAKRGRDRRRVVAARRRCKASTDSADQIGLLDLEAGHRATD